MSYLTITAFVLLVLEIPLGLSFARNEQERLQTHIERDARVLATLVEDTLHEDAPLDNTVIKDYQSNSGGGSWSPMHKESVLPIPTALLAVAMRPEPR